MPCANYWPDMTERDRLRELSERLGRDPLLVQAAGGNTSIKLNDHMWIKASGTWLKDATEKEIFVPLRLPELRQALRNNDPACESCVDFVDQDYNPAGLRPSIETSVHGLMAQNVVLHVHCVSTIARAARNDAEQELAQRLHGQAWAYIPYARPGLQLSHAIKQRLHSGINVLVLGNHGLAVAADTVAGAEQRLHEIVGLLRIAPREVAEPDLEFLQNFANGTGYKLPLDAQCHGAALEAGAISHGIRHVYYPDHVVFLGQSLPTEPATNAVALAVPGKGVLIRKDAKPAVEPMVRCLSDVFRRVADANRLRALTGNEINSLLDWDAEKYRQTIKS